MRAIRDWHCPSPLIHGESGQLEGGPTLMRLQIVRDEPPSYPGCGLPDTAAVRLDVNNQIKKTVVTSKPGTDVSGLVRGLAAIVPPALLGAVIDAAPFNALFAVASSIFPVMARRSGSSSARSSAPATSTSPVTTT